MAIGNEIVQRSVQQIAEQRARFFARSGALTPELEARILAGLKTKGIENPDLLKRAASFADRHASPDLAATLRYKDALVRNGYEDAQLGKRFPVFGQDGNKAFISDVIAGKVEGDSALMLKQLTDPTRLDQTTGTAQVAKALKDLAGITGTDTYRVATGKGLLSQSLELGGPDVPVQVAKVMQLAFPYQTQGYWAGHPSEALIGAAKYLRAMPQLSEVAAKHLDLALGQAADLMDKHALALAEVQKKYVTVEPMRRSLGGWLRGEPRQMHEIIKDASGHASAIKEAGRQRDVEMSKVIGGTFGNIAALPTATVARRIDQPQAIQGALQKLLEAKVESGEWTIYKHATITEWTDRFVSRTDGRSSGSSTSDARRSLFQTITETSTGGSSQVATEATHQGKLSQDVGVAFDQFGHMAPPATVGDVVSKPDNYILRREKAGKPGEFEFVPFHSGDPKTVFNLAEQEIRRAFPLD